MAYYDKGFYLCNVLGMAVTQVGKNETKCVAIEVEPIQIASGDAWVDHGKKVQTRVTRLFLTPKARERSIAILREKLNFTGNSLTQLAVTNETPQVILECTHETADSGKTFDRFEFPFEGGGGSEIKPLARDEIKALDAELSDLLRPAYTAPPAPAKPKPAPKAPTGDEIPY